MAQKADKGKRQFSGNAPVEITQPEASEAGYAYSTVGPDGVAVHDVAVTAGRRAPTAAPNGETRLPPPPDAFITNAAATDACELRNIRATLIKLGPSLQGRRDVLSQVCLLGLFVRREGGTREASPLYVKSTMARARPDAAADEIDAVYAELAGKPLPDMPSRLSVGKSAHVTTEIWQACNSPSYIFPLDRDVEWTLAAIELRKVITHPSAAV